MRGMAALPHHIKSLTLFGSARGDDFVLLTEVRALLGPPPA